MAARSDRRKLHIHTAHLPGQMMHGSGCARQLHDGQDDLRPQLVARLRRQLRHQRGVAHAQRIGHGLGGDAVGRILDRVLAQDPDLFILHCENPLLIGETCARQPAIMPEKPFGLALASRRLVHRRGQKFRRDTEVHQLPMPPGGDALRPEPAADGYGGDVQGLRDLGIVQVGPTQPDQQPLLPGQFLVCYRCLHCHSVTLCTKGVENG